MRVLFVCSGNICRSPFAEALARQLADRSDIEFASAGTIALDGNPASRAGVAVAVDFGIDMQDHRATHLTTDVVASADIIYGMEAEHVASVLALDQGARTELLSPDGTAIPDPYGGDRTDYITSFSLIRSALRLRPADWV